jgi:thioredoxin-dependent peroxiredoxin
MVEVGQTAPDFELPDQSGEPVRLSELRGQKVVVYFYSKATRRDTEPVGRRADYWAGQVPGGR